MAMAKPFFALEGGKRHSDLALEHYDLGRVALVVLDSLILGMGTAMRGTSYESIFGDEKHLTSVLKGSLSVGLNLEKLRCFEPMLVPVHRVFDPSIRRLLIMENEAAFDSFCRWNQQASLWGVIVFGRGLEVWKAVEFLCTFDPTTRYDYLGDFDQHGVCVAARLSRQMNAKGRVLLPLKEAYHFLSQQRPSGDIQDHSPDWPSAISWLDDEATIAAAGKLFSSNLRVAQEAFGWSQLLSRGVDGFR